MVRLLLLGPTELTDSEGADIPGVLTRRKRLGLLSYLALQEPGSFCRRETLVGLLWPDSDETHARASLSVTLHHLRVLLGQGVILTRGGEEIGLDAEKVWVDGRRFLEELDLGNLRPAAELYRGSLLDGFHIHGAAAFTTWLEGERRRLHVLAVHALTRLADASVDTDPVEACRWARRATALAPHDERAHTSLVRALARSSHQAEALRVLDDLKQRLTTELDLEPSAELLALEGRLKVGDRALSAAPKAVASESETERTVVGARPDAPSTLAPGRRPVHKWLALAALSVVAMAAALFSTSLGSDPPPTPPMVGLPIALPEGSPPAGTYGFRLLDDRSGLVYADPGRQGGPSGRHDGSTRLWIVRWSSLRPESAQPIPGTEGVRYFDPSPDGTEIAVIVRDSIRVLALGTVASRSLAPGGARCCLRWERDGWIYFTNGDGGLSRVPEGGGSVDTLTVNAAMETHAWPALVDEGRRIVFEQAGAFGFGSRLAILDTRSGEISDLGHGRYPFVVGGLVVYSNWDGRELRVSELDGPGSWRPTTILDDVTANRSERDGGSYDVSGAGDLIYARGGVGVLNDTQPPVWVSRDGQELGPVLPSLEGPDAYRVMRISGREERIAFRRGMHLYVGDLQDGRYWPVTRDGNLNRRPWWSADDEWIYYQTDRSGSAPVLDGGIHRVRADGVGDPEQLGLPGCASGVTSPDERWWICRTRNDVPDRGNLVLWPNPPEGEPTVLVATDAAEGQPTVSRDGRWFAYTTEGEDGPRVFVASLADSAQSRHVLVSIEYGYAPAFARSSDELFYVGEDGGMHAVRYGSEPHFRVVDRSRLFDATRYRVADCCASHSYDVSRDGQRFVMVPWARPHVGPHELVVVFDPIPAVEEIRP